MAGTGRVMIASGVLILLFVAHQLWGTGIAEARSQDALRDEFTATLGAPTTTSTTTAPSATSTTQGSAGTVAPPVTSPPPTQPRVPPTPKGDAVAVIEIPRIRLEKAVVEGTTVAALKKGPGRFSGMPLPGQPGNAAIAGHRTTYGAPFGRLDELRPGDEIVVTTRQGRFTYRVSGTQVVKPSDNWVLDPTEDNRLTLTTCHPRYSAAQRLIVTALLDDTPAPATPPEAPSDPSQGGEPSSPTAEEPTVEEEAEGELPPEDPAEGGEGSEEPSLLDVSGQTADKGPAITWGLAAAAVWLAAWAASRRVPKLVAYALGVPVFAVVLFQFFENFARLLPANV